jgi:hypothetical protein
VIGDAVDRAFGDGLFRLEELAGIKIGLGLRLVGLGRGRFGRDADGDERRDCDDAGDVDAFHADPSLKNGGDIRPA